MSRVSLLIPARNERFLSRTVQDVCEKARGDVEVLVVLDGAWADPPLLEDPRVRVWHVGVSRGMRPSINAAASIATGDYLMKLDAHCLLTEGFDVTLASQCADDWVVVPRRDRLDPIAWGLQVTGKPPIDAHFLSYPFERPEDPACGLHGTVWPQRARARVGVLLDEEMSSQGSCWFMSRRMWDRVIGPMDVAHYGSFINEFQEVGCKAWLSGGAVMVNKAVTYLHLHKGKTFGRGYPLSGSEQRRGSDYTTRYWMTDAWPDRARNLQWLIKRFSPVPGWPTDLDAAFHDARRRLAA